MGLGYRLAAKYSGTEEAHEAYNRCVTIVNFPQDIAGGADCGSTVVEIESERSFSLSSIADVVGVVFTVSVDVADSEVEGVAELLGGEGVSLGLSSSVFSTRVPSGAIPQAETICSQ